MVISIWRFLWDEYISMILNWKNQEPQQAMKWIKEKQSKLGSMIDTIYKIAEIIYSSLRYYASTDVKELTRVYSLVCLFPSPVHKYKPI